MSEINTSITEINDKISEADEALSNSNTAVANANQAKIISDETLQNQIKELKTKERRFNNVIEKDQTVQAVMEFVKQ